MAKTQPPLKGTIDGFEVDILKSVEHNLGSEVTTHPVEKGADTADHIRLLPIMVSAEIIVSNTPIGPIASRRGDVDSRGALVNVPSDDALAWLEDVRTRREPFPFFTGKKLYENMALETFTYLEDESTGDALRFKVSLRQIELVSNERTTVLVAVPRASKKVQLGTKPSPKVPDVPPPPAAAKHDRSILAGLFSGD